MHHQPRLRNDHRSMVSARRAPEPLPLVPVGQCGFPDHRESGELWYWQSCGEVSEWPGGVEVYFAVLGWVHDYAGDYLFLSVGQPEGGEVVDEGGEEDGVS